jgi:uncharacterized protein (DUF952 family)
MRPTFHLVPHEVWARQAPGAPYAAASLEAEGFVHCTDGADELIATANRYYRDDPRAYVALTIDLDEVGAPWSVEDAAGIYPHVHGAIPAEAIIGVQPVLRDHDGRFVRLDREA